MRTAIRVPANTWKELSERSWLMLMERDGTTHGSGIRAEVSDGCEGRAPEATLRVVTPGYAQGLRHPFVWLRWQGYEAPIDAHAAEHVAIWQRYLPSLVASIADVGCAAAAPLTAEVFRRVEALILPTCEAWVQRTETAAARYRRAHHLADPPPGVHPPFPSTAASTSAEPRGSGSDR